MIVRRFFGVVVALLGLALTLPVLALVALAILFEDGRPVIHRGRRVGRDGRLFDLLKFRTMRHGAPGPGITRADDARITKVGRVLRAAKLDELPQLWNVVKGDMDLVGPRPEDPRYVERYSDHARRLLGVRPGITSPAAVAFRNEEQLLTAYGTDVESVYVGLILPAKLRLDLEYLERRTFWSDLRVLWSTFWSVGRPASPPLTMPVEALGDG